MSLHAPLRMSFPPDAGMFNETFAITTGRPVNTNETTRKRKNMKKLILGVFLAVCWCTGTANAQDIAAKTNLLYWSTTTPNLSLEFGLGQRTTLDLTGAYNPWTLDKDKNKKIKHWLVMPEFRYWLCERYNGHFFGLHSGYAFYNISGVRIPFQSKSTKDHRYQGWATGVGLSYGYCLDSGQALEPRSHDRPGLHLHELRQVRVRHLRQVQGQSGQTLLRPDQGGYLPDIHNQITRK